MAEGGRTTKTSNEDDLLCCTVCMEEYEDPRVLPCLHTFCYRCLLQLSLKEGTSLSPNVDRSSDISQQKSVLKCPLCSEEHPVPKDKGVGGFRKDFRISNLKERQLEIQTKGTTTMVPGNELEKCSFHPDEKLLYHCENESCKLDICEVCWTELHDKHTVTLLSKKLKDARDVLRENVGKNVELIVSHLEMLSHTKEEINDHYDKVKNDMKHRHKKLTDHLHTIFDQRLLQIEKQKKIQVENISDEIKSASALKYSFQQIQYNIDKTNILISSKTLDQYSQWEHQMSQTSSDLAKWNYSYSGVQLHGQQIETLYPFSVEEAIETTTTFSPYKVIPAELTQKKNPKKEEVRKLQEKQDTHYLRNLKYVSSFEIIPSVRSIVLSRNNLLYVVNRNCLVCYDSSPSSPMKKHLQLLSREANAVCLIYSKTGTEFIVVLNNQKKMLSFFSREKQDPVSMYPLPNQPDGILAGCQNILAYSFIEGGKAYVSLLSLTNNLPELSAYCKPLQIPFESGKVRSMHLSISNRGNPVLSCSSVFLPDSSNKNDTAVVTSVISKQVVHCRISFNELDSTISAFNLKSIACDYDYVFVLNSAAGGAFYRITKPGKRVRKMKVTNKDFSFSSVNQICLQPEVMKLFTSSANDTISIFNYFTP